MEWKQRVAAFLDRHEKRLRKLAQRELRPRHPTSQQLSQASYLRTRTYLRHLEQNSKNARRSVNDERRIEKERNEQKLYYHHFRRIQRRNQNTKEERQLLENDLYVPVLIIRQWI